MTPPAPQPDPRPETAPHPTSPAPRAPFHPFLAAAALVALVVLAYLPTLWAGYGWEDSRHATQTHVVAGLPGLWRIWTALGTTVQYYPLTYTVFWIQYELWGAWPAGSHAVNFLLHAAAAVLLWRVLRALAFRPAWFAAAAFALHPIQVESVAWISELKNVLVLTLYLAAALAYFAFAPPRADGLSAPRRRWGFYPLALTLFVLAVLTKTVAAALPFSILIVLWWRRPRLALRDLWPLGPFLIVGLPLGLLTAWMERRFVRAQGAEWDHSLLERLLVAGRTFWFYPAKLLYPAQLSFNYERWTISPADPWLWLYPLATLALFVTLFLARHRLGRGPLAAFLFYGLNIAPALGFFNLYPTRYSFVADHFQYVAGIGLIVLACGGAAVVARRIDPRGQRTLALAAAILLLLGARSALRSTAYLSLETLWRDTLIHNPRSWLAATNLSDILARRGDAAGSAALLRHALAANPNVVETQTNMGMLLLEQGDLPGAEQHLRRALEINPRFAAAQIAMGKLRARQNQPAQAEPHFRAALEIVPYNPDARYNLAVSLANQFRFDEAMSQLDSLRRDMPRFAPAHTAAGLIHQRRGQADAAIAAFRLALELRPQDAAARRALDQLLASPASAPATSPRP